MVTTNKMHSGSFKNLLGFCDKTTKDRVYMLQGFKLSANMINTRGICICEIHNHTHMKCVERLGSVPLLVQLNVLSCAHLRNHQSLPTACLFFCIFLTHSTYLCSQHFNCRAARLVYGLLCWWALLSQQSTLISFTVHHTVLAIRFSSLMSNLSINVAKYYICTFLYLTILPTRI